jgi:RNA polymerase sigma-70 factor (ECF subfamily)
MDGSENGEAKSTQSVSKPAVRSLPDVGAGPGDEWGQLLEGCRQYLSLIAQDEVNGDLRAKLGISDLVQETFLQAQKDFRRFRGGSRDELLAWLRQILLHRLSSFYRTYRGTQKRKLDREWQAAQSSGNFLERLIDPDQTSPSGQLMRSERIETVQRAIARLPVDYRKVVLLRHRDRLTYSQISVKLRRSPDAARMLWYRAIDRLSRELDSYNE